MSDSCPVCSSISITFVRSYRGDSELFRNLELKKCNNCTFVFADPLPKDEELDKYNSSYFVNAHGGLSTHPMATAYQAAINKIRANYVIETIQNGQDLNLKILEIGPGAGDFLKFWLQRFPNSEYSILESDLINRERFKGLVSFQYSSFKEIPPNYFDLIVVSHVLEHTNDPKRFLKELSSSLKNVGFIFIEVPCQDYLFKDKEEPHLLFFNKESMNQLFNRIDMRVISLGYFGPSIVQSFSKKILNRIYLRIVGLFLKFRVILPISVFFPKMRSYLSSLEILMLLPSEAIHEKSNPSWWLRAVVSKNK
ncbi:methyltransferase type 12 [Leptospira kirschneri serovar Pomona]|uniref:Methyltransferase type 12 n=1 Tax=Leptospira kirschneri serovar Pomona TaxID=561005 RepID=A0A1T1E5G2_9LEPT|nr:class I SAM-dependent methyltransferase [Leptospira kirschneri]EMJ93073.1 methyltransferase domain protein [Leptospira kirschneri str. JB]OOV48338.1 methyltransferase type 12 [Leptospira kirschneri serovar Pomona]